MILVTGATGLVGSRLVFDLVDQGQSVRAMKRPTSDVAFIKQVFEFYKSLQGLDRLVRLEPVKLAHDSDFSGEVSSQTKAVIYYRTQAGQG